MTGMGTLVIEVKLTLLPSSPGSSPRRAKEPKAPDDPALRSRVFPDLGGRLVWEIRAGSKVRRRVFDAIPDSSSHGDHGEFVTFFASSIPRRFRYTSQRPPTTRPGHE